MKSLLIPAYIFLLCISFSSCLSKNDKTAYTAAKQDLTDVEVLLIGTFHFANFNPENNGDLVKSQIPDVLTEEHQTELEKITKYILEFKPDKIFVESSFSKQQKLDSIYSSFPKNADFKTQKRNEIIQIGFRTAKLLEHKRVYAMDVRTAFPYDSLINVMETANQLDLIKKDKEELEELEKNSDILFSSGKSLSEMIFYYNDPTFRKSDVNWYVNLANQAGDKDNFVGVHLASQWYQRNLHMYSIIQKAVEKSDERIMILAGASHIAMFNEFIGYSTEWNSVELKEIME
jgi:hypothetical protein